VLYQLSYLAARREPSGEAAAAPPPRRLVRA
jgi:hypothetical protein